MISSSKQAWPTRDTMTQIYDKHFWGGEEFDFYSGYGYEYEMHIL